MTQCYTIDLEGLKQGAASFEWPVSLEFFKSFGNEDLLDARVIASVEARKVGAKILVDLSLGGEVTVVCDRCLEDLVLKISADAALTARFGNSGSEDVEEEEGREVVLVEPGETELDLSQTIYDYVNLAIPIQRVHPEGECDPGMVSRLGVQKETVSEDDSAFASLKELFKEK